MVRFSIIGALLSVIFYITFESSRLQMQENRPPVVQIVTPKTNSTFSWSSLIPYTIHVSDDEDGNSEYDEINPPEVLLVVKYLKDSSEINSYLIKESIADHSPLVRMGKSSCFNCHRTKGTMIGPSFELIAEKYQKEPKAIEFLTDRIIKGGSSIWGDEQMPPHPELDFAQVREMVRWILENNSDPDKTYLTGIIGTIKTKEQPIARAEKVVLVMTASYTDHGSTNQRQSSRQGQNTIILKSY